MIPKALKPFAKCKLCELHKTRHELVFYRGDIPCDVLFIGEAPDKREDLFGEPFIGRSGELLDRWITEAEKAIRDDIKRGWGGFSPGFTHLSHGITNILACMSVTDGKHRPPTEEEARACSPRLQATILAANPKLIILLGPVAKKYYKMPTKLVGTPVVSLQHPVTVLKQGGIGSYPYDQNLLRLHEALETHVYGEKKEQRQQESSAGETQSPRRKTSYKRDANQKVTVGKAKRGTRKS